MTKKMMGIQGDTNGLDYLGYLTWYSIGDTAICAEELRNLAARNNLPETYLPPVIRAVDAFKRATQEMQTMRRKGEDSGECLLVRQVECDSEHVVRHLVLENKVEDSNGKPKLVYTHVATLEYDRQSDAFYSTERVRGYSRQIEEAKNRFDEYRYYYQPQAIRRFVADTIERLNGISVRRSGGVEFVPRSSEELLNALAGTIADLPGRECELHTVPMVDSERQREMLSQKIEEHAQTQAQYVASLLGGDTATLKAKTNLREMVGEFSILLKSGSVTKGKANAALKQFQSVKATIKEYESLLELNLDELHDNMDIVKTQLEKIIDKAE